MSRSLQHRLSRMLALAVLACGVLASAAAFHFAYVEAQEFQDDALRQIAALSAGRRSEIRQLDTAGRSVEDPESRIQLFRLPDGPHPAWLPSAIGPGFHTLTSPGSQGDMRVFVREMTQGGRLAVAQPTESRNEIAFNSAWRTLVPILVLLPILVGLIAVIVRGELSSLRRLAEHLDRQAPERPQALPEQDLPEEITPFVEAINRLLGRVDRMISEQRRFIADAAHELRTPLTALSLQVQNLSQAESPDQMRARLAPLRTGVERARKLTVQLLDLARLQASEPQLTEVDVAVLGRELIAEFFELAESKGIDLGLEAAGLDTLASDPRALRLILRNAMENAIKYTPDGGEVTLRLIQNEAGASIEIVDTGPGIPEPELASAFDPFHRLSDAGEGSGLGLAIAREAAFQLSGSVTLRNRDDRSGLVFRFAQ